MYGILKSSQNTGADSELAASFSTPLSIRSNVPGYSHDSISLRRSSSSSSIQRWEIEAEISPTNDNADFFIHNITNNFSNVIYVRMPQLYLGESDSVQRTTPVGAPLGHKPLVSLSGPFSKGASILSAVGLTTYNFAKGEFIKFQGDPKVYVITDPGTNGSNFKIFPSLRINSPSGVEVIYGANVTMQAYYDNASAFGITYADGIMTQPGVYKLVEKL